MKTVNCWAFLNLLFIVGIVCAGEPTVPPPAVAGSNPPAKAAKPDAVALVGRSAAEVQAQLGKPMGRLKTAAGPLWLYADWKIQFDQKETVLTVEKDAPVKTVKLDPQTAARLDALARADRARAAEADAARVRANAAAATSESTGGRVRVVSNRGERVDLDALLVPGKITIVDFYADWCGPCRQIAPVLEKLAQDNPDIAVVKIDIVNWGTPVATQFGLNSIPNMRVYNRSKQPVGKPTSALGEVIKFVNTAKGS